MSEMSEIESDLLVAEAAQRKIDANLDELATIRKDVFAKNRGSRIDALVTETEVMIKRQRDFIACIRLEYESMEEGP
jgi:hypothetical protein